MLRNYPSLRAAGTSEELEILRAHSVNYSDKAPKTLLDAIGQIKVVLDALTMLSGGGGARPKKSRMLF